VCLRKNGLFVLGGGVSAPSSRPSGLCFEFRKLCECVLYKCV